MRRRVVLTVLAVVGTLYGLSLHRGSIKSSEPSNRLIPSNYEVYTPDRKISTGLVPTSSGFFLNGKLIRILSGAVHYFRIHPKYWRSALKKVRAAGLNTVETYVAWNLHEPRSGKFDFGLGRNDMSQFLDLVSYVKMAQEEDLFVILRPGPYICSEWDFGGLPSWLLREKGIQVRTSTQPFLSFVDRFFENLLPLLTELQFTKGGPIVAFQIENEYGSFHRSDLPYLTHLKSKMESLGLVELPFTSDGTYWNVDKGALPGVLQTSNFQTEVFQNLDKLKEIQPNLPAMVMEFWSGWFDHWGEIRHGLSVASFNRSLTQILDYPASVNFYMFQGGTNFGFMNGANPQALGNFTPDITSYDYDAPLTESGDYTKKYQIIRQLMPKYSAIQTFLPELPPENPKMAYPDLRASGYLDFASLVLAVPRELILKDSPLLSMEALPINDNSGQSYGYILYSIKVDLTEHSILRVDGQIKDFAIVMVNGVAVSKPVLTNPLESKEFGTWVKRQSELQINVGAKPGATLEILVENMGRVNYGDLWNFDQKKGLPDCTISLDGKNLQSWTITPLEFKGNWVERLANWKTVGKSPLNPPGPVALSFALDISSAPADTWLDMSSWGKGIVFVNGFNLGRYWMIGPATTLYCPGPLLKSGENEIIVFEHYRPADSLKFRDKPQLGKYVPN